MHTICSRPKLHACFSTETKQGVTDVEVIEARPATTSQITLWEKVVYLVAHNVIEEQFCDTKLQFSLMDQTLCARGRGKSLVKLA